MRKKSSMLHGHWPRPVKGTLALPFRLINLNRSCSSQRFSVLGVGAVRAKVTPKPFGKPASPPPRPAGPRAAIRPLFLYGGFPLLLGTNALARVFPDDPPRFMARTPHGYSDTALIRAELAEAGFSNVTIETRAEQSRAASARLPAVAYCQGTVFRSEIEAREPGSLDRVTDYVASELEARHGSGEVAAKIQAHIILAAR